MIKNKEIPSSPIYTFIFKNGNQPIYFTNWNLAVDVSKVSQRPKETTKLMRVSNKVCNLIKRTSQLGVNAISTAPKRGLSKRNVKTENITTVFFECMHYRRYTYGN
jgi:hypothetical protein